MDASETITQFAKMLRNLDRWLEAGTAYAEKKGWWKFWMR